jgi:hypothetical protein
MKRWKCCIVKEPTYIHLKEFKEIHVCTNIGLMNSKLKSPSRHWERGGGLKKE